MTSEHTLKIEAARAGVYVDEYRARLEQGQLWCYRCQDWHPAEAFPADGRRHSSRAGSCRWAIRAAARDALAERGQLPTPTALWVIRRLESFGGSGREQAWAYWCGPSRNHAGHGHRRSTITSPGSTAPTRLAKR